MRRSPREIIETFKKNEGNITQTAKELQISRSTVRRWMLRGKSIHSWGSRYVRWKGIRRKSTRPHSIQRLLSDRQEKQIVRVRQQTGYDKRKLSYELQLRHGITASASTIYRILHRRSAYLLRDVSNFRRPQFQNGHAMRPENTKTSGYLQMDVKYVTPELSGLPYTTYEYALIDIISRYKMALILPVLDEAGSVLTLKYVQAHAPFPVHYVQTDNGLEYQSQFHTACERMNIVHYYIHKNSPNENAVVERSFRTDQEEFFFRLTKAPRDINELNLWFQTFLQFYNEQRPHFSLAFKTPLEVLKSVSYVLDH